MLGQLAGINETPIRKCELDSCNPSPDQLFKMDEQIDMEINGDKDEDENLIP